jgi:hypothetical protein
VRAADAQRYTPSFISMVMAKNKFGIPENVLSQMRSRDKDCVYCRKIMIYPFARKEQRDCATIEHLNFDGPFYWRERLQADDIVLCCGSCNSSRGVKKLADWFATRYCRDRNINAKTVAAPVRSYLRRQKNRNSLRRAV